MSHIHRGPNRDAYTPVVVLGEALCDLYAAPRGSTLEEADALAIHSGGAPANVCVQLARLEVPVQLWTAVGDDPISRSILRRLQREGVDTSQVRVRERGRIGLTLVEVDPRGERRFFPFREGSADQTLAVADLELNRLTGASWLLHGTVSLRSLSARQATRAAVRAARDAGRGVVVDVNLRPGMFDDPGLMHELARSAVREADVVKATREEAAALYGEADDEELIARILDEGPALALLTLGEEGAWVAHRQGRTHHPGVPARPVDGAGAGDATGAGDAFLGAALAALIHQGVDPDRISSLTKGDLEAIAAWACAAGSRACERYGATEGMPRLDELAPLSG